MTTNATGAQSQSKSTPAGKSERDASTQNKRKKTLEEVVAPRVRALIHEVTAAGGSGVYDMVIDAVERQLLTEALAATGGNQLRAAEILGINRNTLRRKIDKLGIAI